MPTNRFIPSLNGHQPITNPNEGASKPTYDIWGDTVNVASRLESSGVSGRIQVSEQVAEILVKHGEFEVECRGPIEVRGKGILTTYLVLTPYDSNENDDAPSQLDGAQLSDVEDEEPPEPPPTLGANDEVEELCADTNLSCGQGSD